MRTFLGFGASKANEGAEIDKSSKKHRTTSRSAAEKARCLLAPPADVTFIAIFPAPWGSSVDALTISIDLFMSKQEKAHLTPP
jgi:hypothetical protein